MVKNHNLGVIGAIVGAVAGLIYFLSYASLQIIDTFFFLELMSDVGSMGLLGLLIGLLFNWILKRYHK